MPEANTASMQIFLDRFSQTLPKDEVAVMYADQAGWHGSKKLRIPDNVILMALPAYSPELNPVERIWLYLKEAWNRLTTEAGRITTLCSYPWLKELVGATTTVKT
jgi:transposase